MSRNQAEEIRRESIKLLKNALGNEENHIENDLYGMRYSDLKKELLRSNRYTEGAVTGALNTITERVNLIKKIKYHGKSFFYYSSEENKIEEKPVYITESQDFEDLAETSKLAQKSIEKILNQSGKKIYKEITEIDQKSLRIILRRTNELNESIRDYKQEKSFEIINKSPFDDVPF